MKIDTISTIGRTNATKLTAMKQNNTVHGIHTTEQTNEPQIIKISFKGNPDKNPHQIAAYATESNFLSGIYKAGGLGDVAEVLPESMANYGKNVVGKDVDVRTFLPYYSFDNNDGKIYVIKPESLEKYKKNDPLNVKTDFKLVDSNYKLQNGEQFALITDADKGITVKKMFLLKDTNLQGNVERLSKDNLDMEKINYRVFEVDTNGARKDRMYLIHTPETASGKCAYGIYGKYAHLQNVKSNSQGGTSAYGGSFASGAVGVKQRHYSGRYVGDMFYTEQIRAMEKSMEALANDTNKFNPQSILLHDRFAYTFLSDATEEITKGNKFYQGIKFVPIFHNPGRSYQGVLGNPLDFFKIIATKDDLANLKASKHYNKIDEIAQKIAKGEATTQECTALYEFFKPYLANYMDSEECFNMTQIAINTTKEYNKNCSPGNVSKYYGQETRNMDTEDIAKGLTKSLKEIEAYTIDVVNGSRAANMRTGDQAGFFGTGTLNQIFKNVENPQHYVTYNLSDDINTIYNAKKENKKNLINIIAEATEKLSSDKDAIAKVFFDDKKIEGIKTKNVGQEFLSLGGLSKYKEGDVLFLSWGRPDPQKGLNITAQSFRKYLEDSTIPLETRLKTKLLFGAGGGNDAFGPQHPDWKIIKEEINKIGEIEVNGQKGIFKGNACYINGLFPNRLANCSDASIFTSRYEPCGITPLESFAAGSPVLNLKTGGAPDFIQHGKNGLLTKNAFMLNPEKLGLDKNIDYTTLDTKRVESSANEMAQTIKEYMSQTNGKSLEEKQKGYIENCIKQKIEWHNNNAYNNGRSALEIYLKDKCGIGHDIPMEVKSNGRGKFNENAFDILNTSKPKVRSFWNKLFKENRKYTLGVLGGVALLGLGYTGYKTGWLSPKFSDDKKNEHASRLA